MSLPPACRGSPSACHRNLPLALGVVCWRDHSAVKVIRLLKMGFLPIFLLTLHVTQRKFVFACDVLVTEMLMSWLERSVVLIAMVVITVPAGSWSPEQPTQAKCLVLWFKIWNPSHSLCNSLVGVWWEELLGWMGQDGSGTQFGNVEVTNVKNFSDFWQSKGVKSLIFENNKTAVSGFFEYSP